MFRPLNQLAKCFYGRHMGAVSLTRLAKDRTAGVSIMFAFSLLALVPAIGIAIDYGRIVQFKSALQNAADNAALAGASAYTDTTLQAKAVTTATTYMSQAVANLPTNTGVTVTPPNAQPVTSAGSTIGFTVQIGATGTVKTLFMSTVMSTMSVAVSATAENPILILTVSKPLPSSDASDRNIAYAYAVPLDGSLPPASALQTVSDNANASSGGTISVKLAASQNMGFALQNITGGRNGYGKNGYAAPQGSTNTFYSQSTQVSKNTTQTDSTSKSKYAANTQNCSLIETDIGSGTTAQNSVPAAPQSGKCFSTTPGTNTQNLKLDCTKNHGETFRYFWNDMGGPSDDKDYNDMAFNVTCPDTTGTPKGVALIQ